MRLSIATISLLLATGCHTTAEQPARAKEPTQVIKPDQDGVQRARILAGGYFFKPSHIVVKVNTPVEILASRESGMVPHDLVIDAPEAGIAVKQDLATEPRKIAFTPKRVGSYAIYCSKKPPLGGASHRERGMEGVLEVVP
jgi:plastocyanin domain-containing protein